jgi:predicted DNA-binding ribbon-helix-helix protein
MEPHVDEMELMLGPDPHSKTNCSVMGFKDKVSITFGRVVRESELERLFFTELVKLGAQVKLRSNC